MLAQHSLAPPLAQNPTPEKQSLRHQRTESRAHLRTYRPSFVRRQFLRFALYLRTRTIDIYHAGRTTSASHDIPAVLRRQHCQQSTAPDHRNRTTLHKMLASRTKQTGACHRSFGGLMPPTRGCDMIGPPKARICSCRHPPDISRQVPACGEFHPLLLRCV